MMKKLLIGLLLIASACSSDYHDYKTGDVVVVDGRFNGVIGDNVGMYRDDYVPVEWINAKGEMESEVISYLLIKHKK